MRHANIRVLLVFPRRHAPVVMQPSSAREQQHVPVCQDTTKITQHPVPSVRTIVRLAVQLQFAQIVTRPGPTRRHVPVSQAIITMESVRLVQHVVSLVLPVPTAQDA